jgi:hypothetical protein
MAPFEALYGRKCRTPLNWIEPRERRFYGIDFIDEAEKKVRIIQQNMKATQSRQKSYADKRRRLLEFQVGVGPYRIIEKKGPVAYKLQLPEAMGSIFPVFHVSQLKKCLRVLEERIEPQGIRIKSDLEYREQPVWVLDTKDRVTQNKVVRTYKIQWSHHDDGDATWKMGEYLQNAYKDFYNKWFITQNLGTRFL